MPDARVQAAIENWAPRFIAQGIDYNDFVRTTAVIERWDDWLDAWCDTAHAHAKLGVGAEVHGRAHSAGEAYVRAALCYHFAKFLWLLDMERHRAAARRAIECLYAAHRLLDPTAERIETLFEGTVLVGNLRRPPGQARPPLVLLLPGLDSAKEEFFSWENTFLARGMATLSLDGPGQGETGYTTYIRPDYEVAVAAMLDALAGRGNLDLGRVGAAGISLGGYYAPRAAAFEPRIKAVATISGPYNFGECWPGLPSLVREAFAHHAGARDDAAARRKAHELDLEEALMRLKQPLLVVFGKLDRLIRWEQAERVVAEAPQAELVMYPEGSHGCHNISYKYRPLVADWMRERLDSAATHS
jgi:pimeloyl-ACP methyl ester carboxylesterase